MLRGTTFGPTLTHHLSLPATAQDSVASESGTSLEVGIGTECWQAWPVPPVPSYKALTPAVVGDCHSHSGWRPKRWTLISAGSIWVR